MRFYGELLRTVENELLQSQKQEEISRMGKNTPETDASVDKEGCMLMMSDSSDSGSIPSYRFDDKDETIEFDLLEELAPHLAKDEVAIIMESGAEKLRYVVGYAGAINYRGERVDISLDAIYNLAKKLGKNITTCEY